MMLEVQSSKFNVRKFDVYRHAEFISASLRKTLKQVQGDALLTLSVIFLLSTSSAFGQGASISAELDTSAIKLGGQTKLRLKAEHTNDVTIVFPQFKDTITSHIEIVGQATIDTTKDENSPIKKVTQTYTITSFDTGYWVVPAIRVYLNNDTSQYLETEPVLLEVKGVVLDPQKDVNDIKEPLSLPITWQEILMIAGIIILVISIISGVSLYYLFFKKKNIRIKEIFQRPPLPAHEKALGLLEQLRKKKLWEGNHVKLYHSELTDIIRNYIEERFGVSSPEQVSDETLAAMKGKVDEATFAKLKQMLQLADMVKFAKEQPLPNENELSMTNAVDFVNTTKIVETTAKEGKK